jgi:hypothetical protein
MKIDDDTTTKKERRAHCISVYLNDEELALLDAKRGQRPRGWWLRNAALSGLPAVIPPENLAAHRDLARIRTNVQAVADKVAMHGFEATGEPDWYQQAELYEALHALRAQLVGASHRSYYPMTIDASRAKRPGRRRLQDPRTHAPSVRLSVAELAQLDARRGLAARGEWLRMRALHQTAPTAPPIDPAAWAACAEAGREVHALVFRMDELLEDDLYGAGLSAFRAVNHVLQELQSAVSEAVR